MQLLLDCCRPSGDDDDFSSLIVAMIDVEVVLLFHCCWRDQWTLVRAVRSQSSGSSKARVSQVVQQAKRRKEVIEIQLVLRSFR